MTRIAPDFADAKRSRFPAARSPWRNQLVRAAYANDDSGFAQAPAAGVVPIS